MLGNRILHIILTILSPIIIPIQFVTTFVLGIIVSITFGLLLIPLSLIWALLLFGPLMGLSYVYKQVPILHPFVLLLGIPIAIISDIYVSLIPSIGEIESRYSKMLYCQTFPFTFDFHAFYTKKYEMTENLKEVLNRTDPILKSFAKQIKTIEKT